MSDLRLVIREVRYNQKIFWRNRTAVFFVAALPLVFLFLMMAIFGSQKSGVELHGKPISAATFFVPSIVALSVISATFTNLAIGLAFLREYGVLKRVRGTPVPAWVFIAGQIGNAIVITVLLVFVVGLVGKIVYGVDLPGSTLPGLLLALAVGAAAFSCLGVALTAAIPSENAAPAVTNGIMLPLLFISGIYIPPSQMPDWLQHVAKLFPVQPFGDAVQTAFLPFTSGTGITLKNLGLLGAWGVLGLGIAVWRFRWEPRGN